MAHIEFHVAHMHTEQIFVVQSPLHSGLRTFILILVVSQLINFLSFLVCFFFSSCFFYVWFVCVRVSDFDATSERIWFLIVI